MITAHLRAKTAGALLAALLAIGCSPDVPSGPAAPKGPAVVTPSAPPPAILPEIPQPAITGQVSLYGQPLAGAAISLVDAVSQRTLVSDVQTDNQGRFRVDRLAIPPQAMLLTVIARKGGIELYALHLPAGSAFRAQATGDTVDGSLDMATTIATKRSLPQIQEVLASRSGTPASTQRLSALIRRYQPLVSAVAAALTAPTDDQRVQDAISTTRANPDVLHVEVLTNALIGYSDLRNVFAAFVGEAYQALVTNIEEGGPVIQPQVWHVGPFTVDMPRILVNGANTVAITFKGQTWTVTTTIAAILDGATQSTGVAQTSTVVHDDLLPAASTGGGGNGGGGGGSDGGGGGGGTSVGNATPVDGQTITGNPIGVQ